MYLYITYITVLLTNPGGEYTVIAENSSNLITDVENAVEKKPQKHQFSSKSSNLSSRFWSK